MRPSWVEVDLTAVTRNVSALVDLVKPAELCAVVKADGYGHGDVPVAEAALAGGASWLAVALVEEGIRLREGGIKAPILLLSEAWPTDAAEVVEWDLTPTVYRTSYAAALAAAGASKVQVKVNTGMHRVGVDPADLPRLVEEIERLGLSLQGLWTHFAVSEEDLQFTGGQIERFDQACQGWHPELVHLANTAGAILFPEARRDLVRCGLGIYGVHPGPLTNGLVELVPAMRIVSRVSHLRRLPAGERPSYGRIRPLPAAATVATVPIGYADGVPRPLAAKGGEVLIGGKRYPLAGNVTMDQLMVDVGDDPIEVGDEVVLIGRQGREQIPVEDWAERLGTITWEIVSRMGPRLPRRYLT
ncbi:MAG TPA: alanine racemase [Acidimicrobiia bacterium]|nr:alanine racemase [Acidimicrobiia bacterium]